MADSERDDVASETKETEDEGLPDSKDKGWAWMICLACFVVNAIFGGIVYTFALIYVELLDYFQRSKGETALVMSIFQGVCFFGGPVYSAIVSRLGCRMASSIGSCLMAAGFIISTWAPWVYFLYFSIGILGGAGFGLIYLITAVEVSQYFNRYRSLATGIGVSGVGIGTLVMGPVLKTLVDNYTWRGAVLIEGAIGLNCLVCSMLYRPVADIQREQKTKRNRKSFNTSNNRTIESIDIVKNLINRSNMTTDILGKCGSNDAVEDCVSPKGQRIITEQRQTKNTSNMNTKKCERKFEESDPQYLKSVECDRLLFDSKHRRKWQFNRFKLNITSDYGDATHSDTESVNIDGCSKETQENTDDINLQKIVIESVGIDHSRQSKLDIYKSLLGNVVYIALLVSMLLSWMGMMIPSTYIVDTTRKQAIDPNQSVWIISGMGIANTAGRLVHGAVGSLRIVNRQYLFSFSLLVSGTLAALIPFGHKFELLMAFCVLFGFFSGGTVPLSMVLVADIVEPQHYSDALGVYLAACGVPLFVGTPIAGWLYDVTGTYLTTYIFAGATFILSGLVVIFLPFLKRKQ